MTFRPFEPVEMPPAVVVAMFGMLIVAAVNVVGITSAAVSWKTENLSLQVVTTLAAALVFSFLPLLAAWALRSAWKSAPILATLVGVWAAPHLLAYAHVLSVVCGAAGVAAIIAVWLPSARKFDRDFRAMRNVRGVP